MKVFLIFAVLCFAVVQGKYNQEKGDLPVVYGYKQGDKCPAEHFYDDCNICICGRNGYFAACTRKGCEPPTEITHQKLRNGIPVVDDYKFGEKCPAKHFYNDCNRCFCTDGYSAACTRMACPSEKFQDAITPSKHSDGLPIVYDYEDGQKCPAQRFYNDCNQCACDKDGYSAACTRMACLPKQ